MEAARLTTTVPAEGQEASARLEIDAWLVYLIGGLALTAAYVVAHATGPGWLNSGPVYNLLGGSALIALVLGVKANSPASRVPWFLMAAGVGLFLASDILAYNYGRIFAASLPMPSIADPPHLAFYPLFVAGLVLAIRHPRDGKDRAGLIDAAIVTVALAALLWVYLIAPYIEEAGMPVLRRAVSVAYPAMDIILIAVVARVAAGTHRREPAFVLMLAGAIALLVSDALYGWEQLNGSYSIAGVLASGWAVFCVLLGTAALHPSMRRLSEPAPSMPSRMTRARLALLACAGLTIPLVIVVRQAVGERLNLYVMVGAAGIVFSLVLARMATMMRRGEEAAERETVLRSQARLSSLIRNSSDIVCIAGAGEAVTFVSPSVERAFGHRPEQLVGRELAELVHDEDGQRIRGFLAAVASHPPGQPLTAEFRLRNARGEWREVEALATNLLADEDIEGIVLNIRDVSERKLFEAELEHRAFHDTLTGLPNRALFRNRVEHALASQRRRGGSIAVLFLDLDDFKNVNDGLGHAAGDEVLQEIARRIDGCMRPMDTAARLGGDEFALLLEEIDRELLAVEIAQRLMGAIAPPITVGGRAVAVAASVGIAYSDGGEGSVRDAEELLRNADAAMYMAKEDGKNQHRIFAPEMHARALERLELKADLQRAMEAGEFTLLYQPIIDLARGDIAGMEALLRWEHPTRGTMPPIEFIPLLEDTGLIVQVGARALRQACEWGLRMQQEFPRDPPLYTAVNVSVAQLQRPEFVAEVRDALQSSRLDPASLTLELTETVMMQDMEVSRLRLGELRELGVRLAIDDFGTGYSSLNYVRQFPVDILKIDRSFLADPTPEVSQLTAAIVQVARIFDLKAVAEGIETTGQLEQLQDISCDFGQGFHFAQPLSPQQLMDLARQRANTTATRVAG